MEILITKNLDDTIERKKYNSFSEMIQFISKEDMEELIKAIEELKWKFDYRGIYAAKKPIELNIGV